MRQINLTSRLKKVQDDLDQIKTEFLIGMVEDIVDITIRKNDRATANGETKAAVDTGAYIESHSVRATRGAGRARSSRGKPQNQDPSIKAAQALSMLMEDIASLPKDAPNIYLSNNSPHASLVEFTHGYHVYGIARNKAKIHLENAKNKVRGGP
jgi:hypothetical protein